MFNEFVLRFLEGFFNKHVLLAEYWFGRWFGIQLIKITLKVIK